MIKTKVEEGVNVADHPTISIFHPDTVFSQTLSPFLSHQGFHPVSIHNRSVTSSIKLYEHLEAIDKADIVLTPLFAEDIAWLIQNPHYSLEDIPSSSGLPSFLVTSKKYHDACRSCAEKFGNLIFILPYHLYSAVSQSLLDNVERGIYSAFLPSLALQLAPTIRINTVLLPPDNSLPLQNSQGLAFQSIARTIHFAYQCKAITGTLLPISHKI